MKAIVASLALIATLAACQPTVIVQAPRTCWSTYYEPRPESTFSRFGGTSQALNPPHYEQRPC